MARFAVGQLPALALASALSVGCYSGRAGSPDGAAEGGDGADGDGDGDGDDDDDDDDDGPDGDDVPLDCELGSTAKLRMLTRAELDGSLEAVFGITDPLATGLLPADPKVNGYFASAEAGIMSDVRLEQMLAVSLSVGEIVAGDLGTHVPCAASDPTSACARSFVEETLPLVYRRPVEAAEVDAMLALFTADFEETGDFATGITAAVAGMLMSPAHLYRSEIGDNGFLTGPEIASLLSFTLTGGPPDAELTELADSGALMEDDVRVEQSRRLLATPEGRERMVEFVWSWLELDALDGLTKADPAYDADVRARLEQSMLQYIEHVLYEEDARVQTLLAARVTFVDDVLAPLYGLPSPGGGGLQRTESPDRPGILGQPALLSAFAHPDGSSPVKRGVLVRERLLCQTLPPPPPTVDTNLPSDPELPTTRSRTEAHVDDPTCAGCHSLIDPLGFAFEHYDELGRWRDTENGVDVDATGEIEGTADSNGAFDGLAPLADLLAAGSDVRDCFAMNFHMVAMSAPTDYSGACVPEEFIEAGAEADGNLLEMVAQWAAGPSAIVRRDE